MQQQRAQAAMLLAGKMRVKESSIGVVVAEAAKALVGVEARRMAQVCAAMYRRTSCAHVQACTPCAAVCAALQRFRDSAQRRRLETRRNRQVLRQPPR